MQISSIDVSIIFVYMLLMLGIGFYCSKSNSSGDDYYMASRQMHWLPVGLSMSATMISASSFIGAPGWTYDIGMKYAATDLTIPIALFVSITFFLPVFYNMRVTSTYEYLELRLGSRTRMLGACGFLLNALFQASSFVYIPALILQRFTGISLTTMIIITTVAAIIYTLLGGIKAVIWTDAIQSVMMWGGLTGIMVFIFYHYNLNFFDTIGDIRDLGLLYAIEPSFEASLHDSNALWVILFGGLCMWIKYFSFDQVQVQRMLTSKSFDSLKRAFILTAITYCFMGYLFSFIGPVLNVAFGGVEFENANDIMIRVIDEVPVGLAGIILAALFAAAMSSIDSMLNSMSAVVSVDILGKFFPNRKSSNSLKSSMLTSLVLGFAIILMAIFTYAGTTSSIVEVVAKYVSYLAGPTCGLFLACFLTNKTTDKGVFWGVILGLVITYIFGTNAGLTWRWNPLVGTIVTYAASYLLSMLFKDPQPQTAKSMTLKALRTQALADRAAGNTEVIVPCKVDKYGYLLIGLFFVELIILILMSI